MKYTIKHFQDGKCELSHDVDTSKKELPMLLFRTITRFSFERVEAWRGKTKLYCLTADSLKNL